MRDDRPTTKTLNGASATDVGLVGTWQIARFENTDRWGFVARPYGERPLGYLAYDSSGHVSFQIMRAPVPTPCPLVGGDKSATNAAGHQLDGFVAYFGSFHLGPGEGVVTHDIEGSSIPSLVGTNETRLYRIVGDKLIIEPRAPDGQRFVREFVRVSGALRRGPEGCSDAGDAREGRLATQRACAI